MFDTRDNRFSFRSSSGEKKAFDLRPIAKKKKVISYVYVCVWVCEVFMWAPERLQQ